MNIAVVIPCYNVAAHLEEVVRSIPADIRYIIAVNDCSTDTTGQLLARLAQEHLRLIVLDHAVNQGVGGAMITGYQKSLELGCDITVKMDGDGQMDPAYLPALIQPIVDGRADFVKGNRFRDFKALRSMPLSRRIGNLGLSFMIKAASGYWNMFDPTNGFTAIRNSTLSDLSFNRLHKRYFFETSMILELYYSDAVIQDIPMKARYGTEVSNLSRTRTLFEFPPKLFVAFWRRILLKYFLYDFNVGSLYFLTGIPIFSYGGYFGFMNYERYIRMGIAAPTGTVIIPTLLIILGFQLLLSALTYDVNNYPRR